MATAGQSITVQRLLGFINSVVVCCLLFLLATSQFRPISMLTTHCLCKRKVRFSSFSGTKLVPIFYLQGESGVKSQISLEFSLPSIYWTQCQGWPARHILCSQHPDSNAHVLFPPPTWHSSGPHFQTLYRLVTAGHRP
jgi:hypothetical protein